MRSRHLVQCTDIAYSSYKLFLDKGSKVTRPSGDNVGLGHSQKFTVGLKAFGGDTENL